MSLGNQRKKKSDPVVVEIQKKLSNILSSENVPNEREKRFKDFIEFRQIKEEDYPLIAELYTYPNRLFVLEFHNEIDHEKERLGEKLKIKIEKTIRDEKIKCSLPLTQSSTTRVEVLPISVSRE